MTPLLGLDSRKPHLRVLVAHHQVAEVLTNISPDKPIAHPAICLDIFPDRIHPDLCLSLDDGVLGLVATVIDRLAISDGDRPIAGALNSLHPGISKTDKMVLPYATFEDGAYVATSASGKRPCDLKADLFVGSGFRHVYCEPLGLIAQDDFALASHHASANIPSTSRNYMRSLQADALQHDAIGTCDQADYALAMSAIIDLIPIIQGVQELKFRASSIANRMPHILAGQRGPAVNRARLLASIVEQEIDYACKAWNIRPDRPWHPQYLVVSSRWREAVRNLTGPYSWVRAVARKMAPIVLDADQDLLRRARFGLGSGCLEDENRAMKDVSMHARLDYKHRLTQLDDALLACLARDHVKTSLKPRHRKITQDS